MEKVREIFNRENLGDALRKLGSLRVKISHMSLLEVSILVLVLVLAFTVRLLPMRWGYYLSEFDPYFQFRITDHFVKNGLFSYSTWTNDAMSWWPWGRNVPRTSFPMLGLTGATFFTVLNALGVPLAPLFPTAPINANPVYNFVIIFPAIMAVLTCIVIYYFGKDIGGTATGLFAAFFLAINASYIGRTSLGFFDDETIGIFGILLIGFFFLRSIDKERSLRQSLFYSIAAGVALGYLMGGWGAARYATGMLLVLVVVLLVLRRYSSRLFVSYSTAFGIALFIAINVPFLSTRYLFEVTNMVVFALFLVLGAFEVSRHIKTDKMKTVFAFGFLGLLAVLFLVFSAQGIIKPLEIKYDTILNPFLRLNYPIVESVQEHRPAAWGSIYYDFGIGIFFIPIGLYFAAQNPTNRNVFLIIFGLTSVYFASSMVRLTLLMAPAFCLLWAFGLARVVKPFITVMKETSTTIGRKMRFATHVGREFSAAFLILIFLLLTVSLVLPSRESQQRGESFPRFLDQAYVPTTIATSSVPVKPNNPIDDWVDALAWIRNNQSVQVVVSWWDYGYWITVLGDKPSLADNGTFNWTQIGRIGAMFMSNETDAIKIIQDWNLHAQKLGISERITHVLIFNTFNSEGTDLSYGDEAKWVWFAKIAKQMYQPSVNATILDDTAYGNVTGSGNVQWTDLGKTTLIYSLIQDAKNQRVSSVTSVPLEHFRLAYASNMNNQALWNVQGINAVVSIWEVKY